MFTKIVESSQFLIIKVASFKISNPDSVGVESQLFNFGSNLKIKTFLVRTTYARGNSTKMIWRKLKKIWDHGFLGFNFIFKSWIRLFCPLRRRTWSIFFYKREFKLKIILRLKMEKIYHVTKTPASSMKPEIFFHSTIRWITLSLVIIFNVISIY